MTQYQADARDIAARDRDRGDTRSNDFSCDEALHGVCGDEDTEQCAICDRWVCEEHWAEHKAEHLPGVEPGSLNRKTAEALLKAQHGEKVAKQAELERLYRETQRKAVA
jgi:hypothetical protein